jgi:para-aminobenzoate synthetase component 1
LGLPDAVFGFYEGAIVVDHLRKKLFVTSSGLPHTDPVLRKARARKRMDLVLERLAQLGRFQGGHVARVFPGPASGSLLSNFDKPRYLSAVQKALEHIHAGDIYQVNLSHRFCFRHQRSVDPMALYASLSERSPSPFGAFFDAGDFKIVCSSPERFLHVKGDIVHTRPMKGTRPRGASATEDLQYRRQIQESEKEKAELLMITDLERNDLGRVCEYGSVCVKDMRSIESYATVFQATSTVEGRLRADKDVFDLIAAAFPGGSITGCPKIRSMQIIEELEPTRRGIYTGTMGYIDFSGNVDLNILIRTLLVKDDAVYFQVGGGIVADSTPQDEYEETLVKARAMKDVLLSAANPARVMPVYPSVLFPQPY